MQRGQFVVIDGLDGIGKGTIERAILQYEKTRGKSIITTTGFLKDIETEGMSTDRVLTSMNIDAFSEEFDPSNKNWIYYTAEPSHYGIGLAIRAEIIANNGRDYSPDAQIQAYSLDRLVQMRGMVVPLLKSGASVLQSRSCASTLCYQSLKAQNSGLDPSEVIKRILEHEGNRYQLQNRPDLLIIPTINNINDLIGRIERRKDSEKDDNCEFENARFQLGLKPLYESSWLRDIFESRGTKVVYLDAGISLEYTKAEAIRLYKEFSDRFNS